MENPTKYATVALVSALALSGCGGATPDCGSDETLALVSDIAHREWAALFRQMGARLFTEADAARLLEFTPTTVVQLEHDDYSDHYVCAATLTGHGVDLQTNTRNGETLEDDVTFSVSQSAAGGGEFIVEVSGLTTDTRCPSCQ